MNVYEGLTAISNITTNILNESNIQNTLSVLYYISYIFTIVLSFEMTKDYIKVKYIQNRDKEEIKDKSL